MKLKTKYAECSVDGCTKEGRAVGMCSGHYRRLKLYGDVNHMQRNFGVGHTPQERFWSRVKKGLTTDCWEWQGAVDNNTHYGQLTYQQKHWLAHRLVWFWEFGRMPQGVVRHSCNNRICVNILHLSEGTHADNARDMVEADRQAKGEKNARAKLTEAQVVSIISFVKHGADRVELAEKFSVTLSQINRIASGESWKHIPRD